MITIQIYAQTVTDHKVGGLQTKGSKPLKTTTAQFFFLRMLNFIDLWTCLFFSKINFMAEKSFQNKRKIK